MSTFKKEYDVQASAVITNALVMVADELKEGAEFPPCVYTDPASFLCVTPNFLSIIRKDITFEAKKNATFFK